MVCTLRGLIFNISIYRAVNYILIPLWLCPQTLTFGAETPGLGASLGSLAFKRYYCTEKVNSWSEQLKMLADIVKTQPQAAYAAFTKGFLSKFTYFLRTIEGFGDYIDGIQETISHILVATFFGNEAPFELHHLNLFVQPANKLRRSWHIFPERWSHPAVSCFLEPNKEAA